MCDNVGCVYVQEYKEDHGQESRSVFNTGDDKRRSQLVVDSFIGGRCVQHTDKLVHNALSYRWVTEKFSNFLKHGGYYTGLFISPSGTSELDCATIKKDRAEMNISIGRESLKVFFCTRGLGVLADSTARG